MASKKTRSPARPRPRPAQPAAKSVKAAAPPPVSAPQGPTGTPGRRPRPPAPGPDQSVSPALIGLGAGWALVLLLRAAGVLRAAGSVAFWLVAVAALVLLVRSIATVGSTERGLRGARAGVVLAMAFLLPVVFDPHTHEVFNSVKFAVLVVGALVLLGLWAVDLAGAGRRVRWRNGLQWPVLALLAWTIAATVFSVNHRVALLGQHGTYDGLVTAVSLVVLFFATANGFRVATVDRAVSVLYFGAGGLVAFYGLLQLHDRTFGGRHWDWVRWGEASFKGSSIWSTFGNPNHLAGFLAILLPLGVALLVLQRGWPVRALIAVLTVAIVVEMLQTAARGALVATIAGLVVLGLSALPDIRARPAVVGGVVVALALVVVGSGALFRTNDRLEPKLRTVLSGNDTAVLRVELWKSAFHMAGDRPIVGGGPDTYQSLFPRYQTAKFVSLYGPGEEANGPHNLFVNQLVSTGFPGLAALLAVLGYAALRTVGGWRRWRRREREGNPEQAAAARRARILLGAVAAGAVAAVVQASFNVQQLGLQAVFWLLLGLVCVLVMGAGVPDTLDPRSLLSAHAGTAAPHDETPAEPAPPSRRPRGRARRRAGTPPQVVWTAIVAIALVLALLWPATAAYRGELAYKRAVDGRDSLQAAVKANPSSGLPLVNEVRKHFAAAVKANPREPSYMIDAARFEASVLGQPTDQQLRAQQRVFVDDARTLYRRAVGLDDRNAARWAEYAAVLAPYGKSAEPQRRHALEQAVRWNPWQPEFAVSLGGLLGDEGHTTQARTVVARALQRSPRRGDLLKLGARLAEKAGDKAGAHRLWQRLRDADVHDPDAVPGLQRTG